MKYIKKLKQAQIAKKLHIANHESEVLTGDNLSHLSDAELTNNIAINSNMIDVSFNLECLGLEGVVEAVITLSQGKIVKIEITKLKIKDRYLDANLTLDYTAREEFPVISEEEIITRLNHSISLAQGYKK